MLQQFSQALVLFLFLSLLTGFLYPLAVTGISQAAFPGQANGSLIDHRGTLIGSSLIGQAFSDPAYFWGRPSATAGSPYAAYDGQALTASSGSNLGPLSMVLVETVQGRIESYQSVDPGNPLPLPVDLVTASASGLDPHISQASAYYQVHRIAARRDLDEAAIRALIDRFIEKPWLGFIGEARVNVLLLNLALDEIQ